MPRTLDNHLTGVTAHAPHPASYRPDLPLTHLGLPDAAVAYGEGYDEGYDDGYGNGSERGYDRGYAAGDQDGAARVKRQTGTQSETPRA